MFLSYGTVDVLDGDTSTHMSSIVDINKHVLTSSSITHMSDREWRERKTSGRGNRLPSLIIRSHFLRSYLQSLCNLVLTSFCKQTVTQL